MFRCSGATVPAVALKLALALTLVGIVSAFPAHADPVIDSSGETTRPVLAKFDIRALSKPPEVFPTTDFVADGVRAFFNEGMPWKGERTRVFAYFGVPQASEGTKFPAMVLIHGGGGTAFD